MPVISRKRPKLMPVTFSDERCKVNDSFFISFMPNHTFLLTIFMSDDEDSQLLFLTRNTLSMALRENRQLSGQEYVLEKSRLFRTREKEGIRKSLFVMIK